MATKRTPLDRARKPRISSEAVDLFTRCEQLWPIYRDCGEPRSCRSNTDSRVCPECREFLTVSLKRDALLGLEPWHACIEDIDSAEPPPYLDRMRAKAWRRVWRLRCALEAEVAKRKAAHAD